MRRIEKSMRNDMNPHTHLGILDGNEMHEFAAQRKKVLIVGREEAGVAWNG